MLKQHRRCGRCSTCATLLYIYTFLIVCTHTHTYIYRQTYLCNCTCIYFHIYIDIHTDISIHAYIFTYIYIHIYTSTHYMTWTWHGLRLFLHSQRWKSMENPSLCPFKFSPEASQVPTMRNMPYVMAVPWLHRGTPEPWYLGDGRPGGTHHGDLQ